MYRRARGGSDGSRHHRRAPVALSEGRLVSLVLTDISRCREVERKLAEQASLLDAAIDAILVRDMNDALLYWNKEAERIFGWSFEEAKGIPLQELVAAEDWNLLAEARATLLSSGRWEGELHAYAPRRAPAGCPESLGAPAR